MKEIHVKIGEVKIGENGDILKATLGSCVGIAFIWKKKNVCGLAHCFLPETNTESMVTGGKYVNQAILSLMRLMSIRKDDISEIEVYLCGGGNMMNKLFKSNTSQIGRFNAEAAYKYLSHHGFKITKEALGSHTGSKIVVDCTNYNVEFFVLDELTPSSGKNIA